ncbi:MAG: tetratricopeptide repeat protein [Polyangiaceae bacterium]
MPVLRESGVRKKRSGVLDAATLDADRDQAIHWLREGDELLRAELPDEAARRYARAVTVLKASSDRQLPDAYLRLGHANRALGRALAAIQSYRAALELRPDCLRVLEALASLHAAWKEWDHVARYEDRFIAVAEADGHLHDFLCRSGDRWWRAAGDLDRAHVRYAIAQKRFPDSPYARMRLRALAKAEAKPGS